jgi:hypothetical protein
LISVNAAHPPNLVGYARPWKVTVRFSTTNRRLLQWKSDVKTCASSECQSVGIMGIIQDTKTKVRRIGNGEYVVYILKPKKPVVSIRHAETERQMLD